jgi:hypothetical protein
MGKQGGFSCATIFIGLPLEIVKCVRKHNLFSMNLPPLGNNIFSSWKNQKF